LATVGVTVVEVRAIELIAPGVAVFDGLGGVETGGVFPFCLRRQPRPAPLAKGVGLVPVDKNHRIIGVGRGAVIGRMVGGVGAIRWLARSSIHAQLIL